MQSLKLYYKSMLFQIKSNQTYRFNYYLTIVTVLFHYFIQLAAIWITLNYFKQIGDWNIHEVTLLYAFFLLTYGLMILFFAGVRDFSSLIYSGNFDILLIRPHNILLQVLSGRLELTSIAHFIFGTVLLIWCSYKLSIVWDINLIVGFTQLVLGGSFVQAGLLLFWATCNFWIINTDSLVRLGWTLNANFLSYPIDVYPRIVQLIFTVFPLAFISYYPASWLLNKNTDLIEVISPILILLVGIVFVVVIYFFWCYGINRYKSAGS